MHHVDSNLLQPQPPGGRQRLEMLLSEATSVMERDVITARTLLSEAMALLRGAGDTTGRQAATDPPRGGLAAWQAKRTARHIELHLHQTLTVAELAALVRLSRTHFSAAFRCSFGTPPHGYVLERRIARAKQLMLETDMPLSQIACACGLCDQAHLSRTFRRFEGQSPLLWRRAHLHPGEPLPRSFQRDPAALAA